MKTTILLIIASAWRCAAAPVAELVQVRGGQIWPSNAVAHISTLAETAAQVQAALAEASAVESAALAVSNAVAEIEALENSRNSTGYIRGFVEAFTPGIEADTNIVASIVRFERGPATPTNQLYDIYTYFTSDPGSWPVVRTSESLLRTNAWDELGSVSVILTNVLVGSTLYEAYRNRIAMPLASTSAFFRVFADLAGSGTNQMYFPVRNGVAVNGVPPLTAEVTDGTNVMRWVGGIRVQ